MIPVKIGIRADGGAGIGIGHLKRCVLLANMLAQMGVEIHFFCRLNPALKDLLKKFHLHTVNLPDEYENYCQWKEKLGISAWIFDHYEIASELISKVARDLPVFVIDDGVRLKDLICTALFNGNIFAKTSDYNIKGLVLAGVKYCMLDPNYKIMPSVANNRILISMGGADPLKLTIPILKGVRKLFPAIPVDVVIGPFFTDLVQTKLQAKTLTNGKIYFNPKTLFVPIREASIVISAAGSTCYEVLAAGRNLITVVQADNQVPLALQLQEMGLAFPIDKTRGQISLELIQKYLGLLLTSIETRERMITLGQSLFDGKGSFRVAKAIRQMI